MTKNPVNQNRNKEGSAVVEMDIKLLNRNKQIIKQVSVFKPFFVTMRDNTDDEAGVT
jgi:hypothetical protein